MPAKAPEGARYLALPEILATGGSGQIRDVDPALWFSPLQPIKPFAPSGLRPRQWAFQPGANLTWQPGAEQEGGVTPEFLRWVADAWDLLRLVIETVKDRIASSEWDVRPKRLPGEKNKQLAARTLNDKRVEQLKVFLEYPDGELAWQDWVKKLVEDMLVLDAACYSSDTEVLTKRGWLKFPDANLYDEFATRSPSGQFEWQRPSHLIVKQHCGDVIEFKSRNTDLCVTPNHNMLAVPAASSRYKSTMPPASSWRKSRFGHPGAMRDVHYDFVRADELRGLDNRVMPATSVWTAPDLSEFKLDSIPGGHGCSLCLHAERQDIERLLTRRRLPKGTLNRFGISRSAVYRHRRHQTMHGQTSARMLKMSGDDFCAFMGMWLAEGSAVQRTGVVCVSQLPQSKGYEAFEALLTKILGRKPSRNGAHFYFSNLPLCGYLKQFGHAHDKFVPDLIHNASARQIRLFLDYFALGDGHFRGHERSLKRAAFTTSSQRMADDLQILCQKAGLSASVRPKKPNRGGTIRDRKINAGPGYNVYVRSSERILYRKNSTAFYCGPVHCVTVPNHTLYVRRNGYPAWCGNSIYMERDLQGRIASLRVIDGGTINRCITDQGFTPQPPSVAFQQILYGIPSLSLTTNDLKYAVRNVRANKRYGYSCVEQMLVSIAIGMRREDFLLKYYTSGSIPEALCFLPPGLPMDRVREIQDWFDSMLAGDLSKRRRLTFLPSWGADDKGTRPNVVFSKEPLLKDEADEWLFKIICFNFGVSPQQMIKQMNRASAASSSEVAEEEGLLPKLNWIKATVNYILQRQMGFSDYEFLWQQRQEPDGLKQMQINTGYTNAGVLTRNEVREDLGEDPDPAPEADMLGVLTPTGFVPLKAVPQNGNGNGKQPSLEPGKEPPAEKALRLLRKAKPTINPDDLLTESYQAKLKLEEAIKKVFRRQKDKAEDKAKKLLKRGKGKVRKADQPDAGSIADDIFGAIEGEFVSLTPEAQAALEQAVLAGVGKGLLDVQVADVKLLSSVNTVARDWAAERAAEMVGMKYDAEGNLVENPSAKWAISDSTRDRLREIVKGAFEKETPMDELIVSIRDADSFSDARAETIAKTEVSTAQVKGNWEVWRQSGLVKKVQWLTSDEGPCPECAENEDEIVEFGQPFPSGDLMPLLHVNCRCVVAAVEVGG